MRRGFPRLAWLCLSMLFAIVPGFSRGQEIRFELGQRLRKLEQALDIHSGEAARQRAIESLENATTSFFRGQLATAAGLLDKARLQLEFEKDIPGDRLWAESMSFRPEKRLLDRASDQFGVTFEPLYKTLPPPGEVVIRLFIRDREGNTRNPVELPGKAFPGKASVSLKGLPAGDHMLVGEVLIKGQKLSSWEQVVSVVDNPKSKIQEMGNAIRNLPPGQPSMEKATLQKLVRLLEPMCQGTTAETNYPCARLVQEAEEVLKATQKETPFYGPTKAGQFWLSVPTQKGNQDIRIQIPGVLSPGKKVPVVVAMHGAGGSENMFFDGYGDGLIAKLCEKKGWILVTTRSGLFSFGGGPDVLGVLQEVEKKYPIDLKKVFLVGHSMGAAQAVALAGRNPSRFLAVAALGGGGGLQTSEDLKSVAFFVGCGERDFALNPAKKLASSLKKASVKQVDLRIYPGVEHLIVVQIALPEVFAFFDKQIR
ncbi:MAG: alpha/beta fold hydrolase [Gemmataceae bacterium]